MFILNARASVVALLIATPTAYGLTYKCNFGAGSYLSDRPCNGTNSTQMNMYGPTRSGTNIPYSSQLPRAARAQEFVKYLPSGCATIIEAIRTAPTRGVRGEVVRDLQEEYNQKCSIEDQDARNRLQQEKQQQQQTKLAERDGARNENLQSKLRTDQCRSMRDVISLKRRRENELNSTEVGALRNLENTYNERCITR
jgi:hypothetical protein